MTNEYSLEEKKSEEDQDHVERIYREKLAIKALTIYCHVSEKKAAGVIQAINMKKIPNVTIKY